ncbi:helix-turn-helix domain-containing protein [Flavobacterium sp. ANB]|uniref:helix-turn-helix domain-containing protein n=1 Tax=unclassified Flavobacterium TaxID=196869 RepID=UPI0012B7685A|nr:MULTISPECIES: AraC family transcriptional regulator [unclassified Flavobacterium]MBF4519153.1 helix-turn-helix domain-containing protein [Flavobacterium sp. ANB]MTD71647.1 helix-turn-helix domain-containing protein [Flavobacterium sp. LC2016-13]
MKKYAYIATLLCCGILFAQPDQERQQTFYKLNFDQITEKLDNPSTSPKDKTLLTTIYYNKARKLGNIYTLAEAMYQKGLLYTGKPTQLKYADSIISLTKVHPDFRFPARGYMLKANYFQINLNLTQALKNVLAAEKFSRRQGNFEQNLLIKRYIGLIKIELGRAEEALPLFKENLNYFDKKPGKALDVIFIKWVLSDIYIRLNKVDTALLYLDTELKTLSTVNPYYPYYIMYKGICLNLKGDPDQSKKYLEKAIHMIRLTDDSLNLAVCYYYKGENIFRYEKNMDQAMVNFEKVDSILVKTKQYSCDIRDNYIRLIEIAKIKNNDKKQLYYLNRLIEIDNYFKSNNILLAKNINKSYDTPNLLIEKEHLIKQINNEKYFYGIFSFLLLLVLGFALFYLQRIKKRNRIFQKRFIELMQTTTLENLSDESQTAEIKEENYEKEKVIDLPAEIIQQVLSRLSEFENDKGYLAANLKQTDLARQFSTNSSYLSKIINFYKGKNFNQYINDMRINYAIYLLKNDKKFRRYTIKAISEEVGFSNPESFAKAFHNIAGLQPSYFIKKIEENEK